MILVRIHNKFNKFGKNNLLLLKIISNKSKKKQFYLIKLKYLKNYIKNLDNKKMNYKIKLFKSINIKKKSEFEIKLN